MLRLLSDEDVHDDIVRGLRRREPRLDIVRAVDVGLRRTPDKMILEWSATEQRVLVTGDLNTMIGAAWERVLAGAPMPGVLALLENVGVGRVIEDILLAALCLAPEEMQDQVMYVPLSSVGDEQ
jgi:predicted nuclease of predicted toxin-antitoxin system